LYADNVTSAIPSLLRSIGKYEGPFIFPKDWFAGVYAISAFATGVATAIPTALIAAMRLRAVFASDMAAVT
jgi:hypothetical protein